MSTLAERWQIDNERESSEVFLAQLAKVGILDIGRVTGIFAKGELADVQLYSLPFDIIRCEVISIGDNMNNIQDVSPGQSVLVFYPKSPINLRNGTLGVNAKVFSRNYAKCLPIGVSKGSVRLSAGVDNVSIIGKNYKCIFQDENILIDTDNADISFDTKTGKLEYSSAKLLHSISDEGVKTLFEPVYNSTTGAITGSTSELNIADSVNIKLGEDVALDISSSGIKITGNLEVTGSIKNDNLESPANES